MTHPVISFQDRHVCVIKLNRPERLNAVNPEMIAALDSAIDVAIEDSQVRAIVLAGAGRAFCSGNDLKDFSHRAKGLSRDEAVAAVAQLQDITRKIVCGDKFVIGAIQGWAVGAGFEWAINCDFSIWADDAIGFFPELNWGLFPTGGITALLPGLVGTSRAREMLLFGERFAAARLLEMGIAWRVVPPQKVLAEATVLAHRISALPHVTVRELKRNLLGRSSAEVEFSLESEAKVLVDCLLDPEALQQMESFEQR